MWKSWIIAYRIMLLLMAAVLLYVILFRPRSLIFQVTDILELVAVAGYLVWTLKNRAIWRYALYVSCGVVIANSVVNLFFGR